MSDRLRNTGNSPVTEHGGSTISPMCECGHSKANHYAWNTPDAPGPCHATVYEVVTHGPLTSGGNARPCHCPGFAEAIKRG